MLASAARCALELVATRRAGDDAGACARRVLTAWDQDWTRDQLLNL